MKKILGIIFILILSTTSFSMGSKRHSNLIGLSQPLSYFILDHGVEKHHYVPEASSSQFDVNNDDYIVTLPYTVHRAIDQNVTDVNASALRKWEGTILSLDFIIKDETFIARNLGEHSAYYPILAKSYSGSSRGFTFSKFSAIDNLLVAYSFTLNSVQKFFRVITYRINQVKKSTDSIESILLIGIYGIDTIILVFIMFLNIVSCVIFSVIGFFLGIMTLNIGITSIPGVLLSLIKTTIVAFSMGLKYIILAFYYFLSLMLEFPLPTFLEVGLQVFIDNSVDFMAYIFNLFLWI